MSVNKITAERNAKAVQELAIQPGNDICADCKSRNPRWASHNLGIFLCVNCASVHRKIGTHVSKVKSLSLDSWSKEQVETMRRIGNVKSNSYYNPDEVRNPPPTNMIDAERDSDLEKFIRDKYEYKRFVSKSAIVESHLGPSRSASSVKAPPARSATAPLAGPPVPSKTGLSSSASASASFSPGPLPPRTNPYSTPARSVTQPFSAPVQTSQFQQPPPQQQQKPAGGVWDDLLALQSPQAPTVNASLPLQFQSTTNPSVPMTNSGQTNGLISPNSYSTGSSVGSSFGSSLNPVMTSGLGTSSGLGGLGVSPGAGFFNSGSSFQPQQAFSPSAGNPFSQMAAQQQQQQSFLSPTSPFAQSSPFARQPSPFRPQPQQQPFQPQQQSAFAQPNPNPNSNPFFNQQSSLSPQPMPQFQTTPSPAPFSVGTPFQQHLQQQQQAFGGFQGQTNTSFPGQQQAGGAFGQQQQPVQGGANPFTSWMSQPQQRPPVQGAFGGQTGQWGSR